MPLGNLENDFRSELVRKSVHLLGILAAIGCWRLDRRTAVSILAPLTALALGLDLARRGEQGFARWFRSRLGPILRGAERAPHGLTLQSATWFLIAATLLAALAPRYVTVASLSILVAADTAAALVGRKLGRHRIGDRSLEGSLAFVAAAMLVVAIVPRPIPGMGSLALGATAALAGAIAELFSNEPLCDNLTVPLAVAACLSVLYAVAYPGLDLNAV